MSNQPLTYTQVVDEKSGEIKYVPTVPPNPPEGNGEEEDESTDTAYRQEISRLLDEATLESDDQLERVLADLMVNSKRLRYDRRLQDGKLDSRRLTAYRTSDRLFKKRAIKDKNYQFTLLIDTSGSMRGGDEGGGSTRIQMAAESVARTVKALDSINVRSSVFSMNNAFELLKGFDTEYNDETFKYLIAKCMGGNYKDNTDHLIHNAGGTSEWVAYEQTVKFLERHSSPKTQNVVIIFSDGAPGGEGDATQITLEDGEPQLVPHDHRKDERSTLANFWDRHADILAFGLGIQDKASQVPMNRKIDDITKLPDVMNKLLTELML